MKGSLDNDIWRRTATSKSGKEKSEYIWGERGDGIYKKGGKMKG